MDLPADRIAASVRHLHDAVSAVLARDIGQHVRRVLGALPQAPAIADDAPDALDELEDRSQRAYNVANLARDVRNAAPAYQVERLGHDILGLHAALSGYPCGGLARDSAAVSNAVHQYRFHGNDVIGLLHRLDEQPPQPPPDAQPPLVLPNAPQGPLAAPPVFPNVPQAPLPGPAAQPPPAALPVFPIAPQGPVAPPAAPPAAAPAVLPPPAALPVFPNAPQGPVVPPPAAALPVLPNAPQGPLGPPPGPPPGPPAVLPAAIVGGWDDIDALARRLLGLQNPLNSAFTRRLWATWLRRALALGVFDTAAPDHFAEARRRMPVLTQHAMQSANRPRDAAMLLRVQAMLWQNGDANVPQNPGAYAFDADRCTVIPLTPQLTNQWLPITRAFSRAEFDEWFALQATRNLLRVSQRAAFEQFGTLRARLHKAGLGTQFLNHVKNASAARLRHFEDPMACHTAGLRFDSDFSVADAQRWAALSVSHVTFAELSPEQIAAYVDTGEPLGKAGAYGIQGRAAALITHLSGSYSGIMGLPLYETAQLLRAAGFAL